MSSCIHAVKQSASIARAFTSSVSQHHNQRLAQRRTPPPKHRALRSEQHQCTVRRRLCMAVRRLCTAVRYDLLKGEDESTLLQTPMHDGSGGRTPHYGSMTPAYGEEGSRTPGRSAWDPSVIGAFDSIVKALKSNHHRRHTRASTRRLRHCTIARLQPGHTSTIYTSRWRAHALRSDNRCVTIHTGAALFTRWLLCGYTAASGHTIVGCVARWWRRCQY